MNIDFGPVDITERFQNTVFVALEDEPTVPLVHVFGPRTCEAEFEWHVEPRRLWFMRS
jgi:hypothetical protein